MYSIYFYNFYVVFDVPVTIATPAVLFIICYIYKQ